MFAISRSTTKKVKPDTRIMNPVDEIFMFLINSCVLMIVNHATGHVRRQHIDRSGEIRYQTCMNNNYNNFIIAPFI